MSPLARSRRLQPQVEPVEPEPIPAIVTVDAVVDAHAAAQAAACRAMVAPDFKAAAAAHLAAEKRFLRILRRYGRGL